MLLKASQSIVDALRQSDPRAIGRALSIVENKDSAAASLLDQIEDHTFATGSLIGITGSPGVGKSTLTDRLVARYRNMNCRLGVLAVDPSSPVHGGSLLGDRIRMMRHATDPNVIVRSIANRGRLGGLAAAVSPAIRVLSFAGCDPILIETVGVGQTESDIARLADITVLVMAPGLGDGIQSMKAGLLELADIIVVNKADCPGADRLMSEMEALAHERGCSVIKTCATEDDGVQDLAAAIESFETAERKSGRQGQNHRQMFEREVMEWIQEMIRPQIARELRREDSHKCDPIQVARRIVSKLSPSKELI